MAAKTPLNFINIIYDDWAAPIQQYSKHTYNQNEALGISWRGYGERVSGEVNTHRIY